MANPKIKTRIASEDTFEIVGRQIAAILELESFEQQRLAKEDGENSSLWKLRVFYESSNPIADWVNPPEDGKPYSTVPIVNVTYAGDTFPKGKGAPHGRTHADGTWHVDCYGFGITRAHGASGQVPGDVQAALERNRAARLARNILMAGPYIDLGLPSVVGSRWVASRQVANLNDSDRAAQNILPIRLAVEVTFSEVLTPQAQPVTLQVVGVTIKRDGTGELITYAEVDIDTPAQP